MILVNHPEIDISLKTLYNYIDAGIFKEFNVINLSLRRKPKRKLRKKYNSKIKKRIERKYLNNRLYSDFKSYEELCLKDGKPFIVLQMDTVYNDGKDGPFIQTFMIDKLNLFLAIYHKSKTANDMVSGIETLFYLLGEELFSKYISCILTDRGTEFCKADEIEKITKLKFFIAILCFHIKKDN